MKSKFLSCLAVAAVAAAVMGQGTYAVPSMAPIDMDAARRAESPELDAGINAQDRNGNTALIRAVRAHNLAEVDRLLDAGADWRITNFYDEGPLHIAVMIRDVDIVISLLAHGADPNQRVRSGEIALGSGEIALDYLELSEDPVENAKALRIREILLNAGSEFRPVSPFVSPATSGDETSGDETSGDE